MTNGSRVVHALTPVRRLVALLWRQLGEIDRVLEQHRTVPDREHARATAIFGDSLIVRTFARLSHGWNPSDSFIVVALAPTKARFEQFERWQQVRVVGIVTTAGLTVHALLWVVLPTRFAPNLPAPVWILVATVGVMCIVASRTIAAAWDDWNR